MLPTFSHGENDVQNLRKLNFVENDIYRSPIIQSWATSTASVTEVSCYYPLTFKFVAACQLGGVIR